MNIKQKIFTGSTVMLGLLLSASPAFAHVKVSPNTVGVAASQIFTVNVPNEEEQSTVSVRMVVPEGMQQVMPFTAPGWTISEKKEGEGEGAKVTEVTWTGNLPTGQRQMFQFQAQAPGNETTLHWKNYQTYQDGTVVSWDQDVDPNMSDEKKEEMEKTGKGPDSETKVINDLKESPSSTTGPMEGAKGSENNTSMMLSVVAVLLSAGALGMQFYKKK